ncbi:MAG: RHS repeat-associated core domain-containing protein [Pirellulales bacterium]
MDRVKRIAHASYPKGQMTGNPALSSFDYTWNAASEITSYTGPEGTLNYSYDTTSQLTGASGARSEAYGYDLNGNRTMAGYSTGTGNRLLSDGVYNYTHDNEGNLTVQVRISDSQRTEFTWDHRNRLTKVLVKDSGGTTIREARFTYDVFDRLIGRWIDSDGSGPQAAVQTWHAYDGANPYADFNSAGALTNRYFYAAGIDELMGRMSASGVVDWYMTDLIGSVRQIVNKMGTSTLYAASYDSFGNIASQTGTGDRFKYAARELEAAIDLYHNRARWYDPRIGRFTGEDPIGFEGGDANLFRYVGNNPTNATDPLGLAELDLTPGDVDSMDWYLYKAPAPKKGEGQQIAKTYTNTTGFPQVQEGKQGGKSTGKYKVKFNITADAKIQIDPAKVGKSKFTLEEAYGHEQQHVKVFITEMQKMKEKLEESEDTVYGSKEEAEKAGKTILEAALKEAKEAEKMDEKHMHPDGPKKGIPYDPIGTMPEEPKTEPKKKEDSKK